MPTRYVPVPYEALDAVPLHEWHAVLDLYRRAHTLRWRPFSLTERGMVESWKLSNRRVWALLDDLAALGLLVLARGNNRKGSTITVVCPTVTVAEFADADTRHSGQHSGQQNGVGSEPSIEDPAAQVSAQVSALQMRAETEPDPVLGRPRELPFPPRLLPVKAGQGKQLKGTRRFDPPRPAPVEVEPLGPEDIAQLRAAGWGVVEDG